MRFISAFLILVLVGLVPLQAGVIPGKWQKVDLLTSGTDIVIETDYGEVLDCIYFSSNRDLILVVESVSKEQRRIPKASVKRVTALNYDDSLVNGALFGLIGGASAGIAITFAGNSPKNKYGAGDRVLAAILFGLLGMGVAVLVDYKHIGKEVIYEALPPTR